MPDKGNAPILQVFRRKARQDGLVDCVLAERRLILFETKAPQPISKVHDGVLSCCHYNQASGGVLQVLYSTTWEGKGFEPTVRF